VAGPQGPKGATGPAGAKGPTGPVGHTALSQRMSPGPTTISALSTQLVSAFCQAGETAINGGVNAVGTKVLVLTSSSGGGGLWSMKIQNRSNSAAVVRAYVTCLA